MAESSKQKPTILIIDDDEQIRKLLEQLLRAENECISVASAEEALAILNTTMPGVGGLQILTPTLRVET